MDYLFRDTFRAFKAAAMNGSDAPSYTEKLDDAGGPLPFKGRLEETAARAQTDQRSEQTIDATAVVRLTGKPVINLQDLLVRVDPKTKKADGRVFRILRIRQNSSIGSTSRYAELGLSKTVLKLPEVKPIGE